MAVRAIGYPTFTSPPGQFLRKEIPVRKNQGGAVAVVTVYNDHRLGLYFFELSPLPNFLGSVSSLSGYLKMRCGSGAAS